MESTRPFFERALYLNPSARTFAYATFIGHGALLPGSNRVAIDPGAGADAGAGAGAGAGAIDLDFIHIPDSMKIYKKNVSICGFPSPSQIRVAQTPDRYLEDLMQNGLEECYPTKKNVSDFFQENPTFIQKYGMTDLLQVEQETCNVLSDKKKLLHKTYSITGLVDANHPPEFEVNGLYKFNIVFILRVHEPTDETISFDSPDGESIHYMQLGPFNLFDIHDVSRLAGKLIFAIDHKQEEIEEKIDYINSRTTLSEEQEREKELLDKRYKEYHGYKAILRVLLIILNGPDSKKRITTGNVYNIFKILDVDIAYIIDTSCSTIEGSSVDKRVILPPEVGYGKQKKNRKSRKRKTKKRKSQKIK